MSLLDFLYVTFPVSGVKTWVFLPPLVAFVVSTFTSMGGVSGAFLLLPFQVSVLGFVTPSVSATNFVFNIVAIPSGVYRYLREGRMAWPLTWVVIVGTLPGVFIGYYLRVLYLPDPRSFKFFVGLVLLYIGVRLLYEMSERSFSTPGMFLLASIVGIIGGTYGIGGGAIIAPFCVAVFHLPVYTVAGAALLGTFITSVAGVFFYSVIPAKAGLSCAPDWLLGFLFGVGGFAGMYTGARLQKFVPQKYLKLILGTIITFLAGSYILQYFTK
jgi:uncharacterized membrane protein YfcA